MKRGYLVALAGPLLFAVIVIIAATLDLSGPAGALAAWSALLLLSLCLWIGTAIVSVEKGYHVLLGIALGLFSPLGLLILTLLPNRKL